MLEKLSNLNIENKISSIVSIELFQWGHKLVLHGRDDPIENNVYLFTFKNCKQINWYLNEPDEEDLKSPESLLIAFDLGEDSYRSPAVITTDVCEISVLYESVEIEMV